MQLPKHSHIPANRLCRAIEPFSIIAEQLGRVQALIHEQFCEHPQTGGIEELLVHIRSRSGKMIRPGLVLLSGLCCGKPAAEHIRVAAIFEIIHEATLLHDDVIDEADRRRGQETVNRLYGNESAVLLGDFLLSKVFSMSAGLRPGLAKEIASAAGATCRGELNQNLQKRNWRLSEKEYIDIISDKTADIFRSCCRTGAELSGADDLLAEKFALFGLKFGIAFQIADDTLDIVGDEKQTGKTLGRDLFEAKPTLPLIHLLGDVEDRRRADVIDMVSGRRKSLHGQALTDKLAAMLAECGSISYSKQQVRRYISEATEALDTVPAGRAKTALLDTAEFVLSRLNKADCNARQCFLL